MARLNRIVKLEALEASIGQNRPIASSVSFEVTDGQYCEYTFQGGFILPAYKPFSDDIPRKHKLMAILKKDIPEDLVAHYARIWERFLDVFANELDATDCETITFAFHYNSNKSLDTPDAVYNGDPFKDYPLILEKKVFYLNPTAYVFYDFVVRKGGDLVVAKVEGIPHFALPSLMEFIGAYLGYAESQTEAKELQLA